MIDNAARTYLASVEGIISVGTNTTTLRTIGFIMIGSIRCQPQAMVREDSDGGVLSQVHAADISENANVTSIAWLSLYSKTPRLASTLSGSQIVQPNLESLN